jgi:hypothetical protein
MMRALCLSVDAVVDADIAVVVFARGRLQKMSDRRQA